MHHHPAGALNHDVESELGPRGLSDTLVASLITPPSPPSPSRRPSALNVPLRFDGSPCADVDTAMRSSQPPSMPPTV